MTSLKFSNASKACFKCGEVKPHSEFYADKRNRDGLTPACKNCKYYSQKERSNANSRKWSAANKDRHSSLIRSWESSNKERRKLITARWNEANKEQRAALSRNYRQANKGKIAAHAAVRRARVKQAQPPWVLFSDVEGIYLKCPEGMHVDHTIPLVNELVCGLHVPWNLQYLTAEENRRKKNKLVKVLKRE